MNRLHLLVLDGMTLLVEDIRRILPEKDFATFGTETIPDAMRIVNQNPIDIVVVEVMDSAGKHEQFIRSVKEKYPDIDILILDRNEGLKHLPLDRRGSGEIIRLSKSFGWEDVKKAVLKTNAYQVYQERLQQLDENFKRFSLELEKREGTQIIGTSRAIKSIASLIMLVSKSEDTSVMITGESGTGKELVARAIHTMSKCYKHHFQAVNCSAIPESLFESEFFGYKKGAFTGAMEKSSGWFEMADNGTLFLDEITELPASMQSKFLRVLDDKVVQKIGSHQEVKVNLRIISGTNQPLEKIQNNSILRKDLFHRLNTFHIQIPPLRERKEDIPVLLEYFITQVSKKMDKRPKPVCEDVVEKLMQYSFPGNVRELRNMAESAVILCQEQKIRLKHFCISSESEPEALSVPSLKKNFDLATIERFIISEALAKARFNKSRAAVLLNISRQSLDRKIAKSGIKI